MISKLALVVSAAAAPSAAKGRRWWQGEVADGWVGYANRVFAWDICENSQCQRDLVGARLGLVVSSATCWLLAQVVPHTRTHTDARMHVCARFGSALCFYSQVDSETHTHCCKCI